MTAPVQDPASGLDPGVDRVPAAGPFDGVAAEPARPRWKGPLLAGAAAACGCVAIALIDPTDSGVPICWSQAVFGIDCPLCGGLRATSALMHGDVLAAADHNVLVAVALPVIALVWIAWVVAQMVGRPFRLPRPPRWLIAVGLVGLVAFTVARNVGGPPWVDWLASTTYR